MSENSTDENEKTASAEDNAANRPLSEAATAEEIAAAQQTTEAAQQTTGATEAAKLKESTPAASETATSAIVKIEGQEIPLDFRIAEKDELLKAALSPHYPSIKNANISRETRAGQMIVSIVKRAEHKGSGNRPGGVKTKHARRGGLAANDEAFRRLVKAPETALNIYELAESFYMRSISNGDGDGDGGSARHNLSLADIAQIGDVLRQTENDMTAMKKQFLELATIDGDFQTDGIPAGF